MNTESKITEIKIESNQPPRDRVSLSLATIALVLSVILMILLIIQWRSESRHQRQDQAVAEQQDRQDSDFQRQLATLVKQQQTLNADLDTLRSTLRKQSAKPEPTWVLKEVGYYLRLAILTQKVQGDASSVLALLQEADALLGQQTPKFATLRQAIATKILALKNQPTLDKLKLLTQLASLADSISSLPLAVKIPTKDSGDATQTLLKLIVIRNHDEPIKALLTDEALQAIQQNIQLLLQQAQWAILQRDQAIYQTSLQGAARWVSQYFDTAALPTQNMLAAIKSLQAVNLAQKPVVLTDLLTLLASNPS